MSRPDIQQRLKRHITGTDRERAKLEAEVAREEARKIARQVALKGLKLSRSGQKKAAAEVYEEAKILEKVWRKLGGKGTLT